MLKNLANLVVFGVGSMVSLGVFKTYGLIKRREGYYEGCRQALTTTAKFIKENKDWTGEDLAKELDEHKPTF